MEEKNRNNGIFMIKYKTIDYRNYNNIISINKIREKEPIKLINFSDMIYYSIPFNVSEWTYNFILHTDIDINYYDQRISYYWYGTMIYGFEPFKSYSKWKDLEWRKRIEIGLFL